jgi:hypothetical protein
VGPRERSQEWPLSAFGFLPGDVSSGSHLDSCHCGVIHPEVNTRAVLVLALCL